MGVRARVPTALLLLGPDACSGARGCTPSSLRSDTHHRHEDTYHREKASHVGPRGAPVHHGASTYHVRSLQRENGAGEQHEDPSGYHRSSNWQVLHIPLWTAFFMVRLYESSEGFHKSPLPRASCSSMRPDSLLGATMEAKSWLRKVFLTARAHGLRSLGNGLPGSLGVQASFALCARTLGIVDRAQV